MAWRQPGAKPLSEAMMVRLLTHICFTQPQWVKHWSQNVSGEQGQYHGCWCPGSFCWQVISKLFFHVKMGTSINKYVNNHQHLSAQIMENANVFLCHLTQFSLLSLNSLWPSDASWYQRTRLSLVHIVACSLFGAKPLPKPTLNYCQLEQLEQTSV